MLLTFLQKLTKTKRNIFYFVVQIVQLGRRNPRQKIGANYGIKIAKLLEQLVFLNNIKTGFFTAKVNAIIFLTIRERKTFLLNPVTG